MMERIPPGDNPRLWDALGVALGVAPGVAPVGYLRVDMGC